jgi:hypothetical protein
MHLSRLAEYRTPDVTFTGDLYVTLIQHAQDSLLQESRRGLICEQMKVERRGKHFSSWVKEAIQIEVHPDNINREKVFKRCKAWNPSTSWDSRLGNTARR